MDIDQEHPDYAGKKAMFRRYRDLYVGGEQFKSRASEYLLGRPKEPGDIYSERRQRVFYQNYVGSIIDWYAATLFRREPMLSFEGPDERGKSFFHQFAEDCDRGGTALSDFFRRQIAEALVTGASYILVDFPRFTTPAASRAEEEARGGDRAFLREFRSEDLINYSVDSEGNYEWVVLRTENLKQASVGDAVRMLETRWLYYDREEFRLYRTEAPVSQLPLPPGKQPAPELVDSGRHGLARLRRVPLFEMRVSEGLWLMNKAALLQLEHFNKANALGYALSMSLFTMPVVYTEKDFTQRIGESYYLQLGKEDRFGWTEPEGKVFEIAAENLARLKDEIYRVCYLMTQAGGQLASGAPQSGLSKQRDYTITQEVLRAYGDTVKDTLKRVLKAIAAARQDGVTVDVTGLDEFDIGDFTGELEDAKKLLELGIRSKTLRKQILKKLAHKYLCDARQEIKDQIGREIEEALAEE